MKRSLCIALAAATLLAASPVMAQTKQQQVRESTGEAASQHQLGGLKRDRQISHQILRHERQRHHAASGY